MSVLNRRAVLGGTMAAFALPSALHAAPREVIDERVEKALQELFSSIPGTSDLYTRAQGTLIMPRITKAGFFAGGAYGEGALRIGGATVDYYSMAAASFGFQFGAQRTAQALFFVTEDALYRFRQIDGWELGADAEVTLPTDGLNASLTTLTAQHPVISLTFDQSGILAGASLEGAKYSLLRR
ncbi:MAG: YSC84-related protein [Pseudomonadota bacterium]